MRGVPDNAVQCACGSHRGSPKDGLCLPCRNHARNTRYQWTPERDAMLREAYAQATRQAVSAKLKKFGELTKIPRGSINRRSRMLGLRFEAERRFWTPEDTRFLLDVAGDMKMADIAKRLGRSIDSVALKLNRLGYYGRVSRDGFTQEELGAAIGVSDTTVRRWTARGWLKPYGGVYRPAAVRRFLLEHIADLNLARVDQDWIKGELAEMLRGVNLPADEQMVA